MGAMAFAPQAIAPMGRSYRASAIRRRQARRVGPNPGLNSSGTAGTGSARCCPAAG
jgi:hypothetical protein